MDRLLATFQLKITILLLIVEKHLVQNNSTTTIDNKTGPERDWFDLFEGDQLLNSLFWALILSAIIFFILSTCFVLIICCNRRPQKVTSDKHSIQKAVENPTDIERVKNKPTNDSEAKPNQKSWIESQKPEQKSPTKSKASDIKSSRAVTKKSRAESPESVMSKVDSSSSSGYVKLHTPSSEEGKKIFASTADDGINSKGSVVGTQSSEGPKASQVAIDSKESQRPMKIRKSSDASQLNSDL